MDKKQLILKDLENSGLKGYQIAEKHGVSTAYVSQVKNEIDEMDLLTEMVNMMNDFMKWHKKPTEYHKQLIKKVYKKIGKSR